MLDADRGRGRAAREGRTPRRDVQRPHRSDRGGRPDRRGVARSRSSACSSGGRSGRCWPAAAPDVAAGVEKVGGRVRRRHQARRHPHPGAQARRRGLGVHAQPRGDLVAAARGRRGDAQPLPATDLILDGEAIALDETGRPRPFQDTASTTSTHAGATGIRPFFFDLLLHEGDSLIEAPTRERLDRLDAAVPEPLRVRRLVTASTDEAQQFFDRARRRRSGGRHPQAPRRAVRRRPPRLRLGQGQAAPHPRPRRPRRRVGQRSPQGLALQHPPRRA